MEMYIGRILLLGLVTNIIFTTILLNFTQYPLYSCMKTGLQDTQCNLDNLKKISIVYSWMNGSDICHRNMWNKYNNKTYLLKTHSHDAGELRYSVRSLFKYFQWFEGDIIFVTPGHIPNWLNISHPRVKIVHQNYIIPPEYNPTFNTHVIEQYLYKIPGITDNFIFINDDYIFTSDITLNDLFTCDGGIKFIYQCRNYYESPNVWRKSLEYTINLLDDTYGSKNRVETKHVPLVYNKKVFQYIHNKFKNELASTARHKFRDSKDINVPMLYFHTLGEIGDSFQFPTLEYSPFLETDQYKFFQITDSNIHQLKIYLNSILSGKIRSKMVTLNEKYTNPLIINILADFFSKYLPLPSPIETYQSNIPTSFTDKNCELDDTFARDLKNFYYYK